MTTPKGTKTPKREGYVPLMLTMSWPAILRFGQREDSSIYTNIRFYQVGWTTSYQMHLEADGPTALRLKLQYDNT